MTLMRGRAASPIRVGFIIKKTLMGEVPLRDTGEYVSEAAITDIFGAYKGEVERVNALREKPKHIRGMRYRSFFTAFRFAQLLGLVEYIRDEPMRFPPPAGDLLRIEKPNVSFHIVKSTRKIFRLSVLGQQDEKCWSDLTRAWKEGWSPGEKVEYIPPTQVPPVPPVPPKPAPPKKPVVPPTEFKPYKWLLTPTKARFRSLLSHLYELEALGLEVPEVKDEIHLLSMRLGDWILDAEDNLETAKSIGAVAEISKYEGWIKWLNVVATALAEWNIGTAIEAMEELVRS